MAGVSDKARFYLERAAPQLREFEEKEIFKPVSVLPLALECPPELTTPQTGRDQKPGHEALRFRAHGPGPPHEADRFPLLRRMGAIAGQTPRKTMQPPQN